MARKLSTNEGFGINLVRLNYLYQNKAIALHEKNNHIFRTKSIVVVS